jgi:hypothetical protein
MTMHNAILALLLGFATVILWLGLHTPNVPGDDKDSGPGDR